MTPPVKRRGGEGERGGLGEVLSPCCQASAQRYLRKHRDVATCDACGTLLLAYGNERDYDETCRALAEQGIGYAVERRGTLRIVAKPRAGKAPRRGNA